MNVLAIDQGTSATKALLVGPDNRVLGSGEVQVSVRSFGPEVEADPEELYDSVVEAGRRAVAAAGGAPVDAVGLANQGETVLAWDPATGKPLTPAIVWQDRRSAAVCSRLAPHAAELAEITGLPLDPYFAAPKMTWLRESLTTDGAIGTTDAWLLSRLGAGFVTDAATASRTMLLDLDTADWSDRAHEIFGLDVGTAPVVMDNAGVVGTTCAFGTEVPVSGVCVDQQAALLAQRCLEPGAAKCTYGTGAFLLATTGARPARSRAGLPASVAWRLGGAATYCLDGQVYTAGAALRWLSAIGLLDGPGELDATGMSEPDSGGVTFLPTLAGAGAPYWRPELTGSFTGLRLSTTRGHLARAAAEGIAASVALLARAVAADLEEPLRFLRVDGGLTRSRLLMQAQADLLQVPVLVHSSQDATALGVAALARLGVGGSGDLAAALGTAGRETVIEPAISADEAAERLAAFEALLNPGGLSGSGC